MIHHGDLFDVLPTLPAQSVHCVVTSPPYWSLRDYGVSGQLGLEATPEEYIARMVQAFAEVHRVLRDDGTLWLNIGDSYQNAKGQSGGIDPKQPARRHLRVAMPNDVNIAGLKPKDLVGIPWMLAFALRSWGWYLRAEIVWAKGVSFCDAYAGSVMPESVQDRPTRSHEQVFLLTKAARYFYDAEAVREQGVYPAGTIAAKGSGEREGNRRGTRKKDDDAPRIGSSSRTQAAGFQDRVDAGYACYDGTRNLRTVWAISPKPFNEWTKTARRVRVALDDADGDTARIESPDCPVHGDRPALAASAFYGERAAGELSHTERNDDSPVQLPLDGSASTGRSHASDSPGRSLDSSLPAHSLAAIDRSSEMSRTGLVPLTTEPCTASAESRQRKHGSEASRGTGEPCDHTPESRTEMVDSDAHLSAHTTDRNAHIVSLEIACTCEYYKETTEATSHFATFPPDLVIPCVKAGTSDKGVCAVCGAPWRRVVEKEPIPDDVKADFAAARQRSAEDHGRDDGFTTRRPNFQRGRGETTWQRTCDHRDAATVRATVMDCFSGAGTVGTVCAGLQRQYVGVEINPEYIQIAERRIASVAPLFAESLDLLPPVALEVVE